MLRNIYHFCLAFLGALIYGFPSRRIFVVGITGTKGKSTVIELISSILEAAGRKTALISSIRIKIADRSEKNLTDTTMPGRFFMQRFLRKALNLGCEIALVEVTSQGIIQHRHRFINWSAAIFTNLAPEHIEAHGGFEKYRQAKLSFFKYISNQQQAISNQNKKLFFINKDDPNSSYFIEVGKDGNIILYSKKDPLTFNLQLSTNLIGDFNLENLAAAIAFVKALRIDDEVIKKAINNFKGVPGRMEIVQERPFKVIIDYAHTPDSLEKVYQAVSSKFKVQSSKFICVLGSAGGGRDKWKRPKMGEIAAKYCDEIILTNEDPYSENPFQIIEEIEKGFSQIPNSPEGKPSASYGAGKFQISKNYWKIIDRREAIKKAISLAKEGDIVILTGKGCEPFIHLEKDKKMPWDEKGIVEEILSNREYTN